MERRADGGTHDPSGCPLCGAHHDAVHEGTLVIRGSWSRGFVFEHADGRPHGTPSVSPTRGQAFASALQALIALGFEPSEAQAVLDRARAHVGAEPAVEEVLHTALRLAACPVLGRRSAVREELAPHARLAA
ncbi:MAG TPA: RuvA C-terminal domain-containing protein [Sandaracinaceae bacterium]